MSGKSMKIFITIFCLSLFVISCKKQIYKESAPYIGPEVNSFVGMAYQTWNKPLGIWQTEDQLIYDLETMRSMGIKSLRVEFVWSMIEVVEGKYDFSKPDMLINLCKKYGFKIYPIIGFQWPPNWFKEEHYLGYMPKSSSENGKFERSPLMNYQHPYVQERFQNIIEKIVERYKGNETIAAWILGNEFSYIEYNTFRQLGYDAITDNSFNKFLQKKYKNIESLNSRWRKSFKSFSDVSIYQLRITGTKEIYRNRGVWDMYEFRRNSIANIIGQACQASKKADPDAKISYSQIGVLFSHFDVNVTSEDPRAISQECARRGAPLSFYAINSYMNLNSRESFNLGLSFDIAKALTGLDVLFTEYGATSSEEFLNVKEEKQAKFLKAQTLESLIDKIRQIHIFTWNDKLFVAEREKGFGIVGEKRKDKPALSEIKDLMIRLNQIDVAKLQANILDYKKRVAFLLPTDLGMNLWSSYLNETWIIASYIRRLDIPVTFISLKDIEKNPKILTDIPVLFLSRQPMLEISELKKLGDITDKFATNLISVSDIPAYLNIEDQSQADQFIKTMGDIFGINIKDGSVSEDFFSLAPVILGYRAADVEYFANAGSWKINLFKPLEGEHLQLSDHKFYSNYLTDRPLDQRRFSGPIYYIKERKNSKSVFFNLSLGYLYEAQPEVLDKFIQYMYEYRNYLKIVEKVNSDGHPMVPAYKKGQWIVGAFKELLVDKLGLDYWDINKNIAHDSKKLLVKRKVGLNGGGYLVLLQNFQVPKRVGDFDCSVEMSKMFFNVEADELMVSLLTDKVYQAGSDGVVQIEIQDCQTDLLISQKRRKDFQNKEIIPKVVMTTNRRDSFPSRLYYHGPDNTCLTQKLKQHGYLSAKIGIQHDKDYRNFYVEPKLGYYQMAEMDINLWNTFFDILLFDDGFKFSKAQIELVNDYLKQNIDHKVLFANLNAGDRSKISKAFAGNRDRVIMIDKGCQDLSYKTLSILR